MRNTRALVFPLFGISGACGLVYEVAWSKYLSLFMGSSAYSHMIVLATFMGGLALGSAYWGRRADGLQNPLRTYGLLELVIGGFGVAYPFLMVLLEKVFLGSLAALELTSNEPTVLVIKLGLSVLSLILPTFCMGGTLPLLLKVVTTNNEESGSRVASLYWINSLGAVLGASAAGFFLIRLFQLDVAIWLSSGVSGFVGLMAIVLARGRAAPSAAAVIGSESGPAGSQRGSTASPGHPRPVVRLALIAAAVSGFISMVYEIAWIRLLATILGSSTYSFTIMLVAFITGIAFGGWIVGRLLRRGRNLLLILALCQAGTAVSMLAMMPFYERLPYLLWKLSGAVEPTPEAFTQFLILEFLFCLGLMIIPTTLSGMSLPVAARIAAGEFRLLGRRIGNVFAVNTVGAVAGTLATGVLLIPLLGVKGSIEVGIAAGGLLGLVILARDAKTRPAWKFMTTAALLAAGGVYLVGSPDWNRNVSNLGVYRILHTDVPVSYDDFLSLMQHRTILSYEEGLTANVAVVAYLNDGVPEKSLLINGKADASTGSDLPTQILLAQAPLLMGPDSGDVLVIGLGSGITAASALTHPIRSLDCVEISPEVVRANRFFEEENRNFTADPRVRLIVDDAITFVKANPRKYSAIISEPSNPWIAGIGNLFTSEFFDLCRERLEPDGILAQWFHTYDVNDEVFQLVLRTLAKSFPHVTVWTPTDADAILIASLDPLEPDFDMMGRKLQRDSVRADLGRIRIPDVPTFLSTQIAGDVRSTTSLPDGPVNAEKHPVLEFLAPVSFFTHATVTYTKEIDRRFVEGDSTLLLSRYNAERGLSVANLVNIAEYQSVTAMGDFRIAYKALSRALAEDPNNEDALNLLALISGQVGEREDRLAALSRLAELHPDNPELLLTLATEYGAWRRDVAPESLAIDLRAPIATLRQCIALTGGQDERCWLSLGEFLALTGEYGEAAKAYASVMNLRDIYEPIDTSIADEQIFYFAAENFFNAGETLKAMEITNRLRALAPDYSGLAALEEMIGTAR